MTTPNTTPQPEPQLRLGTCKQRNQITGEVYESAKIPHQLGPWCVEWTSLAAAAPVEKAETPPIGDANALVEWKRGAMIRELEKCGYTVTKSAPPAPTDVEARLRELLAKATPLPWRSRAMGSEGARIFPDTDDKREATKFIACVNGRDTVTDFHNGELIAAAVNALPSLLAKLAEQEAERTKLRETGEPGSEGDGKNHTEAYEVTLVSLAERVTRIENHLWEKFGEMP